VRNRGDALLFAVTAQRRLSWAAFSHLLDAIFVPDERIATDVRHMRSAVASLFDSLGHWDLVPSGATANICVAPPVIARLPQPGRPAAILCGSRSPDTLTALDAACRALNVDVQVADQSRVHPYAPSRVELIADGPGDLNNVAERLGIRCDPGPTAWALADACGSVADFVTSLHWSASAEPNWPRWDFDPEQRRFVHAVGDPDRAGLSLSSYRHPAGWARHDILWCEGEGAAADRDWARYAVLADRRVRLLQYNANLGVVTAPRQVPLPRLAARSFGLCSGRPPAAEPGDGLGLHVYGAVPLSVFRTVAAKLGQAGTPSELSR
jgi:hypothetical protein